ncbi:MAG: hypothetical protein AB7E73_02150 [Burkholderiales bacterium]
MVDRNRAFLDGLDPEYFSYLLDTHIETEDEKRGLVALKIGLHHSIETLFSLLGAFVQAPDCAYAWIAKCSNADLRTFVDRITQGDASLISKLDVPNISWKSVSNAVFNTYQPGTERQAQTIERFASLWRTLSRELLDQAAIDEYNALKHGFRIRSGGFALAVGAEDTYGVPPPDSEMKMIGKSNHGATFLKIENMAGGRLGPHIRSRKTSINWTTERVILQFQLVGMSINNVVSGLKILNGYSAGTCKFLRPQEDADFEKPWQHSVGVTRANFDYVLDEDRLPPVTKTELLSKLRSK